MKHLLLSGLHAISKSCWKNWFQRSSRSIAVGSFIVLSILMNCPSAMAYDSDTHFWLTYYIAIKVGYSPLQAQKIASADVSVDYDAETNPLLPKTLHREDILTQLHTFPNTALLKQATKDLKNHEELKCDPFIAHTEADFSALVNCYIDQEERYRWFDAKLIGNPGIYLHFIQDRFAHRGFTSRLGHARLGHLPDFLSSDEAKATDMVRATILALQKFMVEGKYGQPSKPDVDEMQKVLSEFEARNPSRPESEFYMQDWRNWDPTDIPLPYPLPQNKHLWNIPDIQVARLIVENHLHLAAGTTKILWYDLRLTGMPAKTENVGILVEKLHSINKGRSVYALKGTPNLGGNNGLSFKL